MTKKRDYAADAATAALAFVREAEMAADALQFVMRAIGEDQHRLPEVQAAYRLLSYAVGSVGERAYKRYFMLATIDPRQVEAARELAMRRFLSQHNSVMDYLESGNHLAGSWMAGDEAAFRDQIAGLLQQAQLERDKMPAQPSVEATTNGPLLSDRQGEG